MYFRNQVQGFPIKVTFLTKYRTLTKDEINSKTTFNNLLENFQKNSNYKNQTKPKTKYFINGKEIRKNQTLEEIILQNMSDPTSSELFLDLNDCLYSGDKSCPIYTKIIHPKSNPFGLFVFSTKNNSLSLKTFPEKTINLFELNEINEGSSFCNSKDDLYISGSKENNDKNFWIIDNKNFNIRKKNMPFSKKNHSMVYLNFNQNEEWIFIAGGNDKKSFYFDLNKNYFINWGDTNDYYTNPALIRIGEYLYIFDSINNKKNFFERTKIINPKRKWEKVIPTIDKKLIHNFPSEFGVSFDLNGNILFIGGNNIINSNNTYIFDQIKNEITLSQNGTNDSMVFSDKTFYKINNRYNIAFPKNFEEKKEICLVDKEEQSLMKISIELPEVNRERKILSKINFGDKKYLTYKYDEGSLTIKELDTKDKKVNYANINNIAKPQYICNNCIHNNKDLVCNLCHRPLQDNAGLNDEHHQEKTIKEYPYIEKIHDKYYPTGQRKYAAYGNFPKNDKVKVEYIYDEYTPIKVNYELGKPYLFKYKKIEKKEEEKEIKKKEEIQQSDINNINIHEEINAELLNDEKDKQQEIEESQEKNDLFISDENLENREELKNLNVIEEHNEIQEQQETLEPYINEEENIEQENEENPEEQQYEEEQDENKIEEKNEEYNEQIEEEQENYQQYHQNNLEENSNHEILRDSLEIDENNKEKEILEVKKEIKDKDKYYLIKPMLKLDFGFKEHDDYEEIFEEIYEEDLGVVRGLRLKFDEDKNKIKNENKKDNKQNINIEVSNELKENTAKKENQENFEINGEEPQSIHEVGNENDNLEENNEHIEEEIQYENHENENEENGMEIGNREEEQYEQGEEVDFEENEEGMNYEEENINIVEQTHEYEDEENNENQIKEENQEEKEEFEEGHYEHI